MSEFQDTIVKPEIIRRYEAVLFPVASALSIAKKEPIRVSGIRFLFRQEYVVSPNFHPKAVRQGRAFNLEDPKDFALIPKRGDGNIV